MDSHRDVFSNIYKNHLWGDGSQEYPSSGLGSSAKYTFPYVDFVSKKISELNIESVLDVGHGDWSMWRDYQFENVEYCGVDVVDGLSERLSELYGTPRRKFVQIDSGIPLPMADLLLCKDVLQHISNKDVASYLSVFSKYPFVLICNSYANPSTVQQRIRFFLQPRARLNRLASFKWPFYFVKKNNSDISAGSYRTLDITASPFIGHLDGFEVVMSFEYSAEEAVRGIYKKVVFLKKIENGTIK